MSTISAEDLIFYREGDNIYSGGFSVNSILLKQGYSPIYTMNYKNDSNFQEGGSGTSENVSDLFKDLAIPSGLLYLPNKFGGEKEIEEPDMDDDEGDTVIHEDIHDKLLQFVSKNPSEIHKKKTAKRRFRNNAKITKKHRKSNH